ncbi:MAG: beta-N-acetylglucosaminidase domain-containing protein [Sphingomonadaceae bacterium]|nr:beta-N-acetylglucosaminidase domain-containing protein [Sphingomonadaceae bacterium]
MSKKKLPPLGLIEGFFGPLWSWEERRSVAQILAAHGYAFYHYAPKGDALLREKWQTPYATAEVAALRQFADFARGAGLRFGVGLSPFGAQHGFDASARAAMRAKLAQLDEAGIDTLAILFDDMDGAIADLAQRQAEIIDFVTQHSRARDFYSCPSYYSDDAVLDRVFGARPAEYLEDFGRLIHDDIAIYWTGEEVCSRAISAGHIADVTRRLGRAPAIWDNWPVNDGARMRNHLHLRGFAGRDPAIAGAIHSHAVNPCLQPILSCIAAITLPRLYAEGAGYRYMAAFLAAAEAVCGVQLADMLHADLLRLEDGGLMRIDDAARAKLSARYKAVDHAAAREVVRWLAGDYAKDADAVQTQ